MEEIFQKEEELSPRPIKTLHVKNKQRKNTWEFSRAELDQDKTPSNSNSVNFLQIVCEAWKEENEELKKKLADLMTKVQSKYGFEVSAAFLLEH